MTKRKTQFRATYLLGTLVVVAVLIGINLLGRARFERFDLTKDRIFTVSPAMRQILVELPDVVKITYYISRELPDELVNVRRETLDRFQELERLAGGKLEYRIVDVPKEIFDEQKRGEDAGLDRLFGEISAAGIEPVALSVQRRGSAEQVLIFSAITLTYLAEPTQYIDPYVQPERLEYDLALILVRLTQTETGKPIIAFYDGKPKEVEVPSGSQFLPPSRGHEFSVLIEGLNELFDVREIKLAEQSPIPEGTRCLIVAQPNELNERQRYEIGRFVSSGGSAIFFVSRYVVDISSGRGPYLVEQNTPGLEDLLRAWGIELGDELVADAELGQVVGVPVRVQGGYAIEPQLMPTLIILSGEELNQQSPLTSKLAGLYFKNATPIRLDDGTLKRNGLEADALAQTSQHTWLLTVGGMPYLSPLQFRPPQKEQDFTGPEKLAVVVRGTFPFPYAGKAVPAWPASADREVRAAPSGDGALSSVTGPSDATEPEPAVEETGPASDAESEPAGPETHLALAPDEETADEASVDEASADEASVDEAPPAENGETTEPATGEGVEEMAPVVEPVVAPPLEPKAAAVLVVSTAELIKFASPDMTQSEALVQNHRDFLSGALETLAQSRDLASIRAKTTAYRPFEKATRTKLTVYTILNMIPVPVVVVSLGLIRYGARRRSRRVYRNKGLGRAKRVEEHEGPR